MLLGGKASGYLQNEGLKVAVAMTGQLAAARPCRWAGL